MFWIVLYYERLRTNRTLDFCKSADTVLFLYFPITFPLLFSQFFRIFPNFPAYHSALRSLHIFRSAAFFPWSAAPIKIGSHAEFSRIQTRSTTSFYRLHSRKLSTDIFALTTYFPEIFHAYLPHTAPKHSELHIGNFSARYWHINSERSRSIINDHEHNNRNITALLSQCRLSDGALQGYIVI